MRYVRENLAVCGFVGIGTREQFIEHGFNAQIQCAESFDPWLVDVCDVLAIPFLDGLPIPEESFERAKEWFLPRWKRREKILVSCAGGQSRSVSMATALLSAGDEIPFRAALDDVLRAIPDAYPHPMTLTSAARLAGSHLSYDDLRSIYGGIALQARYPWTEELLHFAAGDVVRQE